MTRQEQELERRKQFRKLAHERLKKLLPEEYARQCNFVDQIIDEYFDNLERKRN